MTNAMTDEMATFIRTERNKVRGDYLARCNSLSTSALRGKKNPYLFVTFTGNARDYIEETVSAVLSASAETTFGALLEKVATAIIELDPGAQGGKSPAEGLDADIIRPFPITPKSVRGLIAIKSGNSWGNSSSTTRQGQTFKKSKKNLPKQTTLVSIMGICYGQAAVSANLGYADVKLAGQTFWFYLTNGDPDFYYQLAEVLAEGSADFSDKVLLARKHAIERLLREFQHEGYADDAGLLNVRELLKDACGNLPSPGSKAHDTLNWLMGSPRQDQES